MKIKKLSKKKKIFVIVGVLLLIFAYLWLITYKPCPLFGHEFNEGYITTEATCFREGVQTYKCKKCGFVEEKTIPINPDMHNWLYYKMVKTATCAEDGKEELRCSGCGEKKIEKVPSNNNHKYGSWVNYGDKKVKVCLICGHKKTKKIEKQPYEGMDASLIDKTQLGKHLVKKGDGWAGGEIEKYCYLWFDGSTCVFLAIVDPETETVTSVDEYPPQGIVNGWLQYTDYEYLMK